MVRIRVLVRKIISICNFVSMSCQLETSVDRNTPSTTCITTNFSRKSLKTRKKPSLFAVGAGCLQEWSQEEFQLYYTCTFFILTPLEKHVSRIKEHVCFQEP